MKNVFYFFIVSFLFLSCTVHQPQLDSSGMQSLYIHPSSGLEPDSEIESYINIYKEAIEKEMSKVLTYSEFAIEKSKPDGALNQLVADMVMNWCKKQDFAEDGLQPDFCLLNHGGVRKALPKGEIRVENIFELMPFENELVIVQLSGEKIEEMFQFLAKNNDGHPISNASFEIINGKVENIKINNSALDKSKSYNVASIDYLMFGNDGMTFFVDNQKLFKTGVLLRDAYIEEIPNMKLDLYYPKNFKNRIIVK